MTFLPRGELPHQLGCSLSSDVSGIHSGRYVHIICQGTPPPPVGGLYDAA